MKMYVGNLAFSTTESALREAFAAHGTVDSCQLVMNRDTGQPRGFGFVEMADEAEANRAIAALNGTNLDGRSIKVNEAQPQAERSSGGGYGRSGGGGGGYGRSNSGGGYGGGGGYGRR
jgi:RNA recognition motif-containing protein